MFGRVVPWAVSLWVVRFSDLVFCLTFFHYTTRHFGIERYTQKIKRFVFKSFFNSFVGVLAWVDEALGEHSNFDGDTAARFSVGTFPELEMQNNWIITMTKTRGGALGRVQNLRRQYCLVTQVNLISYSFNLTSTVLTGL